MEANKTLAVQSADKIAALIQDGRDVVQQEANALQILAARIDHHFAHACQLLLQCEGRVIVTGIGKSGHIGRKIAATFASTGSPAFFLHPAEAKHGDAGVITAKDVIIMLSYSGESEEVLAILPLVRHLRLPCISLTGNAHSALAKSASVNLDVSVEKEACQHGLAPTSSTTVTLAMGDALAMTISKERHFTIEQFALSHPGGLLGRRLLLKVDDIMNTGTAMPTVDKAASLTTALMEMTHKRLGMTIVLDEHGLMAGIFTDGDLRRVLNKNVDIHQTIIGQVMNATPRTLEPGTHVTEALRLMKEYKITSLIVMTAERKPMGVIHMHDILRVGIV
jgi:arabinose-5-phosphate isomerase